MTMGLREDALAQYDPQPGDPPEEYITPTRAQIALGKAFDAADAASSAAGTAQSAAEGAQSTANAALPKAGGTMTGAIEMSSQKITGMADGTSDHDAVNLSQLDAVANAAMPSARVLAGVWSGTLDGYSMAYITLPTSPTGRWSVVASPLCPSSYVGSHDHTVFLNNVSATSADFVYYIDGIGAPNSSRIIHWQAVAY